MPVPHALVSVIIGLAAAATAFEMGRLVWGGWDTLKWPHTDGHFLWPSELVNRSLPQIPTCEFTVDGQTYLGYPKNHHSYRNPTMEELMSRFPADNTVTVYYNPLDPSDCVLRTGVGVVPLLLLAVATAMLFFAVRVLVPG